MTRSESRIPLYGVLLYLLPRRVRRAYGEEMETLFRHHLSRARGARRIGVWLRAFGDLVRHGTAERVRRGEPTTGGGATVPAGSGHGGDGGARRALGTFLHDVRFAVRMVVKSPGFSLMVVITLALGIGANTALFSIVNGVLLEPLPYPDAGRLVFLQEASADGGSMTVSYPNFDDWRARATTLSNMVAGYSAWQRTVYGLDEPISVPVMGVSRGFFELFGAEMLLGRTFRADETTPGGPAVAVVSHRFWSRWLGANPDLEELTVDFGGSAPIPVVGVVRPGFRFLDQVDIWFPFERSPVEIRNAHNHWVVGRLAEGKALQSARDELDAIAATIKRQYPDESQAVGVHATPLRERVVGDARRPLWILLAAATLVLLVACINVASYLLARGAARRSELATRRALGAGRVRLVMQLFTESLLLAGAGALLALALAGATLRALRVIAADRIPRLDEIGLDPTVLAFCLTTAVFAALLFGLVPALRITRPGETLAGAARGGAGARREAWRGLVGIEVALSVILLVGTGLLVRSMLNIFYADTGFDRDGVVAMEFSLPAQRYGDNPARIAFLQRLREELSAVPGVDSVGLVNALPLRPGFKTGPVVVLPYADVADPDEWDAFMRWRVADAGYFEAMGIELLRGRLFTDADVEGAPGVAVVNQPLAERLWPGEDPLGKRLRATWDFRGEDLTVIGVVEEARHWAADPGVQTQLYVPWMQRPEHADAMVAVARTPLAPGVIGSIARQVIRGIDPDVLAKVSTLDQQIIGTLTDRTFNLVVLGGFALLALLLSLTGIYGVVAYSVAQRTREIGIRMALGARPARVRSLLQRHTLVATIAGAAFGCGAAATLSRLMSGLLYGIEPLDPVTLVAAPVLLSAVALVAGYIPARRTTRVDPVITLRAE